MTAIRSDGWVRWWRVLSTGILIGAAALLFTAMLAAVHSDRSDQVGWDLRVAYLPAAEAVREGESPYPALEDPRIDLPRSYVYPPQLAIALVPLTALPVDAAVVLVFLASVAALMGALALVGVRDVRCYGAVLLWGPTFLVLDTLNVSAALAFAVALLWRARSTLWPLATVLGLMVSIKLLFWPMLLWAALTRRLRAAGLALAIGLAVTLVSWAAIGFADLASYPDLLSKVGAQENYSILGMTNELGLGSAVGHVLTLVVGGALFAICVTQARRGDERRAFTLAIAATLALSHLVWLHYIVVLLVPLGLLRPRFSVVWLLPIALWVSPRVENGDGLEPFVPAVLVVVLLAVILAHPRAQTIPAVAA